MDLTNQTFGQLTVQRRATRDAHRNQRWLCVCTCGNTSTVPTTRLTSGRTQSCGCLRKKNPGRPPQNTPQDTPKQDPLNPTKPAKRKFTPPKTRRL